MEIWPVDVEPEQIVRYVLAESRSARPRFNAFARRAKETRDIPPRKELRLGDEDISDVSESVTLATLDVSPAEGGAGWRLSIVVEDEIGPGGFDEEAPGEEEESVLIEDEIGPRLAEDASGADEQEIDLETFYEDFIRPGRGAAYVVAQAEGDAAKARLSRLLGEIESDRHRR